MWTIMCANEWNMEMTFILIIFANVSVKFNIQFYTKVRLNDVRIEGCN